MLEDHTRFDDDDDNNEEEEDDYELEDCNQTHRCTPNGSEGWCILKAGHGNLCLCGRCACRF
jgi:hypothetical protein